jgi:hypothetical protein
MGKSGGVAAPPIIIPPQMNFTNPYNDVPSLPETPDIYKPYTTPMTDKPALTDADKQANAGIEKKKFSMADTIVTSPLDDNKAKARLKTILG